MKPAGSDKLIRSKSPKIEEENGLFPELEDYMKRTDRKVSNMIRKRNLEIDVNQPSLFDAKVAQLNLET